MWTRIDIAGAVAASLGLALAPAPPTPGAPQEAPAAVSFKDEIAPILKKSCVTCHGAADENGDKRVEAMLDLTTYEAMMKGSEYGAVVEAGNPDESMLLVLVEDGDMPDEGDPLPAEQIQKIRAWIAEGAKNN